MRDLVAVPADPGALLPALRAALDGSGPAVLPVPAGDTAPPDLPARVPQPVAVVVRTSGSSGTPKLVALTAGALLASAAATESALGGPGEWLLALPGHYIAGVQVIVRAFAAGAEPHLMLTGTFTGEGFAQAVAAMPADRRRYSAVVPTQLARILDAMSSSREVRSAVHSLDALLVGGGRLSSDLADRADLLGVRVRRTYGSSETAGGCVYDGVPLAGVTLRIVHGEVRIAGPMLAQGYLGDPERTAATFVDEPGVRWYRTGDAGEWDGERLAVTGRLDDVVITGGEKVSLGLVEQAVQEAGVADAVVVAADDAEWGQVPVVVTTDAAVALDALRATVGERLGRHAAPRRIVVVAEIPLLPSGKPDRQALAAACAR